MSEKTEFTRDENEPGAERSASAMKDQLSKEVAAWNKQRDEPAAGSPALRLAPAEQPPRRASGEKRKSVAPPVAKPAAAPAAPFKMSYDGQTQADYARYRLERKAR